MVGRHNLLGALSLVLALALAGCGGGEESKPEPKPTGTPAPAATPTTTVSSSGVPIHANVSGVAETTAADAPAIANFMEVADRLAADLAQVPGFKGQSDPTPVELTSLLNKIEGGAGTQLKSFAAKLRKRINDKGLPVVLTEKPSAAPATSAPAPKAAYSLKGEILPLKRSGRDYFTCVFQLLDLKTGAVVWEGSYETRAL